MRHRIRLYAACGAALLSAACGKSRTEQAANGEAATPPANQQTPVDSSLTTPAAPVRTDTAVVEKKRHSVLGGALVGAAAGHAMGHHALAGAAAGALLQHERNKHEKP